MAQTRLRLRKTPRQPRSARMVEAIIEAAARILETRGLAGFNTNAVAERAGISVGSLYQYFPNKDALIAALSDRERARLVIDIAAARPTGRHTLESALRQLVRAAIHRQIERPELARMLDFEEQRLVLDAADRTVTGTIAKEISALLRTHQYRIRVTDIDEVAFDLIAVARALIDSAASRGPIEPDVLEDRVVRTALGYLTSRANVR